MTKLMRSCSLGAVFALAFGILILEAGPASASCAGPPTAPEDLPVLFEGRVVEQLDASENFEGPPSPNYRWVVDEPINGVEAGETVDIVMSVPQGEGGMVAATSVDIGPAPVIGERYRVGAYRGGEGADDLLFTNACGGVLDPLGGIPTDPIVATSGEATGPTEPSDSGVAPLAVAGAVVAFAAGTGALWWARRRAGAA